MVTNHIRSVEKKQHVAPMAKEKKRPYRLNVPKALIWAVILLIGMGFAVLWYYVIVSVANLF